MIMVAGHVCLDVIPTLDRGFAPTAGALHEIGPAAFSVGGPVGNVGGALARLGVSTQLVGRIGRDPLGRIVEELLASIGGRMERTGDAGTSYTIVLSPPGTDRTFLHHPGSNDTFGGDDLATALDALEGEAAGVLHFGYPPIMRATYADGGRALADAFAHARARGIRVGLDMSTPDPEGPAGRVDWGAFLRRVLPHVDVFMPSWDDMAGLLPDLAPEPSAKEVRDVAEWCLGCGAGAVLFKLGDDGAYLRTGSGRGLAHGWGDRELWSANFRAEVRGTTGAGDATNAGFLAALDRGEPPEIALTWASAAGACSVEGLSPTEAVPSLDELRARIAAGWERAEARLARGRRDETTGVVRGGADAG